MSRSPGAAVGGQAVIEGVMMRSPTGWAVAVRRPDGIIEAEGYDLPRLSSRSKLAKIPFLRGITVLIESLSLGFKALSWSAQKSGEEEEELKRWQVWLTMVVGVVFALGLLVIIPVMSANWLKQFFDDSSIAFVILDGVLRIAVLVGYIALIARSDDIQRVFQYHGAEHKTIHAYEAGDRLTIEEIQKFSPRHPRCGTSFLVIVGLVAFFVFLVLAPLALVWQVVARIVLIPVVAGAAYEVLKAGATSKWLSWANRPGIWLQSITTNEPTDDQVEVAIVSLLTALTEEEANDLIALGGIPDDALNAESTRVEPSNG
ncbi:hypothetical protein BMS3Bbin02_02246 [bacterium BMS3Bbin02]|nr:hypothetical protein BMS3Bbin02_02246 [bacterium BMS3Bbin02]